MINTISQLIHPNMEELHIEHLNERLLVVNPNPEAANTLIFSSIVHHIIKNEIKSLYSYDRKNNLVYEDQFLHKSFKGIHTLDGLNQLYSCAESELVKKAFNQIIPSYIVSYDHDFWQKHPNDYVDINLNKSTNKSLLLNDLCRRIYELSQETAYKQEVQNRLDKSNKQFKAGMKLINNLFDNFSKVVFIRIDLSIKNNQQDSLPQLKIYLAQFLKKLLTVRNDVLPHVIGYVWKLEFGIKKGHHYHCIVCLDGNKYSKDSYYAQKLGELWVSITKGEGIFHNCNTNKFKYRHLAIGCIAHDDVESRKNIELVMKYLSKVDQFLIEKTLKKYRTFGTSTRRIEKSAKGRPRTNT